MKHTLLLLVLSTLSTTLLAENWKYTSETDDFTDQKNSYARVKNVDDTFITVRCSNETDFEIIVKVGKYIGSDKAPVKYRIDKNEVERGYWTPSTTGTALFVSSKELLEFSKKLSSGNSIVIQAGDYNGTPIKSRFTLKGASTAIEKIKKDCEYPKISSGYIKPLITFDNSKLSQIKSKSQKLVRILRGDPNFKVDQSILNLAAERLIKEVHVTNKYDVDAVSWICNLFRYAKRVEYRDILKDVVSQSRTSKLRSYANKALDAIEDEIYVLKKNNIELPPQYRLGDYKL